MTRKNFKNIQIQGKIELAELFEDTYEQSGANSKGEFLNILLDTYLNPNQKTEDTGNVKQLLSEKENLEAQKENLDKEMNEAQAENQQLKVRLGLYENDILKKLLKKHKGKTLHFRNPEGDLVNVDVFDLPDVYKALINSIEV
jgi:hypothetical protein